MLPWWLIALLSGPVEDDRAVKAETERPTLELLEFLGSFETVDGEWLDPLSLDERIEAAENPTDNHDRDEQQQESREPDRDDAEPDAAVAAVGRTGHGSGLGPAQR